MASVQVATASGTLVAADPDSHRRVVIANLGPQPIFVETTGPATAAGSLPVAATTGVREIVLPPGVTLTAICGTLQVTPADTRVLVI
jgi:hypothetical protein